MTVENVKGTKDRGPQEMLVQERVVDTIKQAFLAYGFVPLGTPALENFDVLSAKGAGGDAIKKETYNFKIAGRHLGLKYDQTVPLARYIAMNPHFVTPFKRYQYDRAWRYEDIKTGRYREFYQFDIDTVGSESMRAEAELLAAVARAIRLLGFKEFVIRINDRKLLNACMTKAGLNPKKSLDAFRAIDKLEKIGKKGVLFELIGLGIDERTAKKLLDYTGLRGNAESVLARLEKEFVNEEGFQELSRLMRFVNAYGIGKNVQLDLSIARGLDYYTGPVFEVEISDAGLGSVGSGGRYDNMIGLFLGQKIPAVGFSFGVSRIVDVLKIAGMVKEVESVTDVFVCAVNESALENAIMLSVQLRDAGLNVETDVVSKNLKKQIAYADKKQIPFIIVLGPKEIEKGIATIRDMKSGKETRAKLERIAPLLLKNK